MDVTAPGRPVAGLGRAVSGVGLLIEPVEIASRIGRVAVVGRSHRRIVAIRGEARFGERCTGNTDRVPSASWTLPACARSVGQVRQSVVDFACANGVPEPPLYDMRLAVSEAVTNAVVHAFRGVGDRGTVIVVVTVREREWIDVRVTDDGSGMAARDDSPGLGLGLPLIRHLADQFDHRRPPDGVGTELWMRFTFAAPAPSGP